jgi:hypothetical protein
MNRSSRKFVRRLNPTYDETMQVWDVPKVLRNDSDDADADDDG